MLLIIPSIDLQSGNCKDCICSTLPMVDHYKKLQENPEELSRLFRRENAKSLHINDLDSLVGNDNQSNLETLLRIKNAVEIPVQVYAKFKSYEECSYLLEEGIYRIVVDQLFENDPSVIEKLISDYTSSRISFYAKINIEVDPDTCVNNSSDVLDCIRELKNIGGDRIILKDMSMNKDLRKSIKYLNEVTDKTGIKVTLHDAARNYSELNYINKNSNYYVDSIILGEALYQNNFPCQEIWRMVESRLEIR